MPNKTTLVCFREGSDEIVGLSVTYVSVENDPFWEEVSKAVFRIFLNLSVLSINFNEIYVISEGTK